MKRIITSAAACAIALGTVAAPAHAATVGEKDADGNCTVTLTDAEKEFIMGTFDESKKIGEHERARDFVAAVETVYPGVMSANESDLKGEAPDYSKILPADLVTPTRGRSARRPRRWPRPRSPRAPSSTRHGPPPPAACSP